MRNKLTFVVVLLLPLALVLAGDPPAAGDDAAVLASIDKGRAAFVAGNHQQAIEHLQAAIGLIQERALAGLASFLPARNPAQWEMGEVDSVSGNWGAGKSAFQWTQVTRTYDRKGAEDGPSVTVMISNSPQLIEAQRGMVEMLKNPDMRRMMTQAQEGQKIDVIEEGEWIGMITTEAEGDTDLQMFHKKVMVQISVSPNDEKLAREFWAAVDRAGLAAAVK